VRGACAVQRGSSSKNRFYSSSQIRGRDASCRVFRGLRPPFESSSIERWLGIEEQVLKQNPNSRKFSHDLDIYVLNARSDKMSLA
jgi:hypothetical protein